MSYQVLPNSEKTELMSNRAKGSDGAVRWRTLLSQELKEKYDVKNY